MEVKKYISSGVIETYVLGLASEQEARELEQLCAQYPEIRAALDEAENALERYALANAVPLPDGAKEKIWSAIEQDKGEEQPKPVIQQQPSKQKDKQKEIAVTTEPAKPAAPKIINLYSFAAAASIVLLIGSIVYMKMMSDGYEKRIAAMEDKQTMLFAQNNENEKKVKQYQQDVKMMTDPAIQKVALMGTPAHADMKAMVYWDSTSKDVYLALNNLPKPPAGMQYQLWAIVDGQPVDAGMYDNNASELQKMRNIAHAEMFAITLEHAGGSLVPTMDQMYVAGKI